MRSTLSLMLSLLILVAFFSAPFIVDDWQLSQLTQFIIYGMFSLSLAFIWGQVGLMCFGHALYFGAGAYVMALVSKGMVLGLVQNCYLGLVLAMLVPAGIAFILGLALFKGRALIGAYFGIVTMAAAIITERIAINWAYIGGFNGLLDIPSLNLGFGSSSMELIEPLPLYIFISLVALCVLLGLLLLTYSSFGTVLKGIRDNEYRMSFMGYNVPIIKAIAFSLSAMVAGLAGALFSLQFGFVSPTLLGFGLSTEVLIWVALGGKEVLLAAFLGAIVVKWVENVLSDTIGQYWLLALGILFIISVVFLPKGLLGKVLELPLARRLQQHT